MKRRFIISLFILCLVVAGAGQTGYASTMAVEEEPGEEITQEELGMIHRVQSPNYRDLESVSELGPVIPGLMQGLIPQGIAFYEAMDWIIVSYYRDNGKPSMVSVVDKSTGELVKSLNLYRDETTPYTGHSGGLTVSEKHLWVTSEKSAYAVKLEDLAHSEDGGRLVFSNIIRTETNASFVTYDSGILWVGEFSRFDFKTEPSHHMRNRQNIEHSAWVAGYRLTSEDMIDTSRVVEGTNAAVPDVLLSITDEIQGMAFADGHILLSQSYGRAIESSLHTYQLSLEEAPHAYTDRFDTGPVPIWFLDGLNKLHTVVMPPMSEGIVESSGNLYILFESGAETYRDSFYPIDRIYIANTDNLLDMTPTVPGAPIGEAPLLITEVVAASPGEGEPYEYIELYNNSNRTIDLAGYKMYYYYDPANPERWNTKVTKWLLMTAEDVDPNSPDRTDSTIKPHHTKIVWLKKPGHYDKTVQDFNTAYGTKLKAKDFVYIKLTPGQGLSNTTQRFLSIVAPRGDQYFDRISYVTYNGSSENATSASCGKAELPCDFEVGESIIYFYPEESQSEDVLEMSRKVPQSLHQAPTPGKLLPEQIRSIARGR
ncbi:lamin tail domain-containing protein [Paenibacillus sp. J2TS4]|uniref:lamin tail domain-containing protein n=1 Tax=Paenibacillus sp. J2TS4 TaxID=2807194 RepID=UPI001B036256|nr:lamin tail domain-containing protein [Paenibacillus sp. J2TS4]GIP35244.1 hypothetical protein J2TS4_44540 [Paenibacillus sp. J2TS4]